MGAARADEDAPVAASDDYDPWQPFNEEMFTLVPAGPAFRVLSWRWALVRPSPDWRRDGRSSSAVERAMQRRVNRIPATWAGGRAGASECAAPSNGRAGGQGGRRVRGQPTGRGAGSAEE